MATFQVKPKVQFTIEMSLTEEEAMALEQLAFYSSAHTVELMGSNLSTTFRPNGSSYAGMSSFLDSLAGLNVLLTKVRKARDMLA